MNQQDDFSSQFAPEPEKAAIPMDDDDWKILLVDDEQNLHEVLRLALNDIALEGRSLSLLNATNAEQAKIKLRDHPDIALMLLNVAMETEQVCLELVRYIRQDLANSTIQIVLLTDQPGYTPQREVIQGHAIDGYRLKSELNADQIFITVYAALRTHNAMRELHRQHALQRESEARYADLYNNSPDMYASVDASTSNVLQCNQTLCDKLGYDKSELIGQAIFRLYHPDSLQAARNSLLTFQNTGEVHNAELQLMHKNGSKMDVNLNVSGIHDEQGKLICSRSCWTDITEQKHFENQLRKERDFAESLIKTAPIIILVLDKQGGILRINPYMEKISGYTQAEVKDMDWFSTFLPEDCREQTRSLFLGAINDIQTAGNINTIIIRNGEERIIEWYDKTLKDSDGNTLGLLAIGQDITERYKAEKQLIEMKDSFKSMTDTSPLAIFMSSGPEQTAKYINPTFTNLFGYTIEELPSAAAWWPLAYPDEAYRQKIADEWRQKVEKAIQESSSIEPMQTIVTCKDGTTRNMSWGFISTGVQDWAFGQDLTDIRNAQKILQQSEHRLAEAQRIAHLGNWYLDLSNNKLEWSDEIFHIFEINKEHFSASYEAFLNAIHPEDRERVNYAYAESLSNRQPYTIVHRLLMKDGRIKYVEERCETYYDQAGKALASAGTVHDITELKLAEQHLHDLNRDLEQRVIERTAELKAINQQLESFNELMTDREMRVIEVKMEINQLCKELGREIPYRETENAMNEHRRG